MQTTCRLPGGIWDASGELHRDVDLTGLTGREEEVLIDRAADPAMQVTTVLSRCLRRIGTIQPVTEAHVGELLVGDRQFLMMKLRQLTFGDKVQATTRCPWPDCGEEVDIDFLISEVPIKEVASQGRIHRIELESEIAVDSGFPACALAIDFRLPSGADQEAVSPVLAKNESMAVNLLLTRCIERIGDQPSTPDLVQRLSPAARVGIERAMEAAAPGIDLNMEAQCPRCGRAFGAPFDVQDFLLGEASGSRDLLLREIHYLALHYHWSENDILQMSRKRRRRYIEILSDEMERIGDVTA